MSTDDTSPKPPGAPPAVPGTGRGSGRVQFDSRGQAVWEWAVRTGMFDRNASTQEVRALLEAPLALEPDGPPATPAKPAKPAAAAAAAGRATFDPYERVATKPKAAEEASGTDPYSRGGARRPENLTFNPYQKTPPRKP